MGSCDTIYSIYRENARIKWIDNAKSIGIVLVVLGHLLPNDNLLKTWIYSFHMPMFFIISGFLFTVNNYGIIERIKRRAKTLLLPYVIYFALSLMIYFVADFNLADVANKFIMLDSLTIWNSPLWFLYVLFFSEILFAAVHKLAKTDNARYIYIILSAFIGYVLYAILPIRHFAIEKIMLGSSFLAIGWYLKSSKIFEKIQAGSKKLMISLILIIVNVLVGVIINKPTISMYGFELNNYWLFFISAISGSAFLFLLCDTLIQSKLMKIYASGTLFIMCTHYIVVFIYNNIVDRNSLPWYITTASSIIITLIIFTMYIPAIKIAERWFPLLLGIHYKQKIIK